MFSGLTVSIPALEKRLQQYLMEGTEEPFNMKSVPLVSIPVGEAKTDAGWLKIFFLIFTFEI